MDKSIAAKSISLISSVLDTTLHLTFSGGEPLLNFDMIKFITCSVLDSTLTDYISFSLITNGILIDQKILRFLEKNKFSLQLSVPPDGLDNNLKNNCLIHIINKLKISQDINLSTNSVFTPESIPWLEKTISSFRKSKIESIGISFDLSQKWNIDALCELEKQLEFLYKSVLEDFKKSGSSPISLFNTEEPEEIHGCGAGNKQITITTEGDIWGCDCFYYYFKNIGDTSRVKGYKYGNLIEDTHSDLVNRYLSVQRSYMRFRADRYHTHSFPCFLCPDLKECFVCPAINYEGDKDFNLFSIPSHVCSINKMIISKSRELRGQISDLQ